MSSVAMSASDFATSESADPITAVGPSIAGGPTVLAGPNLPCVRICSSGVLPFMPDEFMVPAVRISEEGDDASVPETEHDELMVPVVSDHVAVVRSAPLPATSVGSDRSLPVVSQVTGRKYTAPSSLDSVWYEDVLSMYANAPWFRRDVLADEALLQRYYTGVWLPSGIPIPSLRSRAWRDTSCASSEDLFVTCNRSRSMLSASSCIRFALV